MRKLTLTFSGAPLVERFQEGFELPAAENGGKMKMENALNKGAQSLLPYASTTRRISSRRKTMTYCRYNWERNRAKAD